MMSDCMLRDPLFDKDGGGGKQAPAARSDLAAGSGLLIEAVVAAPMEA